MAEKTTLIQHIKLLVQAEDKPRQIVKGKDMANLPCIENAWLIIEGEKIADFGTMGDVPAGADIVINAKDKMVFPCWCDSHTHLVYAGSREQEFVGRIKGLTYEEIARQGGGILNSSKKLQSASEDILLKQALERVNEIKNFGTGAVEIKSGYGLTIDSEIKMLRVIKKLKTLTPVTIKATFLGAHAIPAEYRENRESYINLIIHKMLPRVADEKLADYCDVFCDDGFFTVEETDDILRAASDLGLKAKIHANELGHSGGIGVGVKNAAVSVDHLEHVSHEDILALLESDTMPTLLPSTAFFLGLKYAPARKMIDAGLPIALATDYNPGTTPSGRMSFVLSLACIKMKMTPEEAVNAATINGAKAMELHGELGSIARGKKANIFITKKIPSVAYIPYAFGSDLIETVIINGRVQKD